MTAKIIETKTEQIIQLESEIAARNADVENLREALATLRAGRLRPVNPSADDVFNLLKELVGSAPQQLEERQIYEEKLKESERALQLAVEALEQKQSELRSLREERRSQQASELAQELVAKAEKFNVAIDQAFELLNEMKTLNGQISQLRGGSNSVLKKTADVNEIPYCRIAGENVLVGRRFDIKR